MASSPDNDNGHDYHALNGDAKPHAPKKPRLSPAEPITEAEIRSEFSHHDPKVARINNGSFGCCPASVIAAQRSIQSQFLAQPDRFYFNDLKPGILRSRTIIQSLINAEHVDEVSIVDNATTAAAIVLNHVSKGFSDGRFSPGDAVLMLHYSYGSVKKSAEAYITRAGGRVIEAPLPFPVSSEEQIVSAFRTALESAKGRVRLAVIDHVTSMPCVVVPVKRLVRICRDEGVDQIFIDAAHGIGCTDVDVAAIGADFYTSNLHKWFFCPPSIALLYCRRRSGPPNKGSEVQPHHPVVSHEYGNGLAVESAWIGTRDYSPQLVVPAVVEFMGRFEGGIEGIKRRNHEGAVKMGEMLAEAWGTALGCPPEMCASMVMVGLPPSLAVSAERDVAALRTHLRDEFGVEVPLYYRPAKLDGDLTAYARISHQVYNRLEDYTKFRDAVNVLVSRGFTCSLLFDKQ